MSMYIRKMSFGSFSGFLSVQEKIRFSYSSLVFEFFFFVSLFSFFVLRCNHATPAYAIVAKEKKNGVICPSFSFPIVFYIS